MAQSNKQFPDWNGHIFAGALAARHLRHISVKNGEIVGDEPLLQDLGYRIRDVEQGPDGFIYVLTDSKRGQLLRLTP